MLLSDVPERVTTDGRPPAPDTEHTGAPQPIDPTTGQHRAYWVLSAAERAKGFVRPVRNWYVHSGARPKHPTRELTEEEKVRHAGEGYIAFEEYVPPQGSVVGRFWTEAQLKTGCGQRTSMSDSIAETYARDPKFYGSTFCSYCRVHKPVGEFVWVNAEGRVTDETVGS